MMRVLFVATAVLALLVIPVFGQTTGTSVQGVNNNNGMSPPPPMTANQVNSTSQTYPSPANAASAIPSLSTFLLAAQQAGLAVVDPNAVNPGSDSLSDPNLNATIFAPSNSAFQAYMMSQGLTSRGLLVFPDLARILQFHIVGGQALQTTSLIQGEMLPTRLGPDLTFYKNGSQTIVGGGMNNATITTPNIMAGRSILNIIDMVLMPPAIAPSPARSAAGL